MSSVRLPNLKAICLIFLAAVAVYAPSLGNGFVWDDTALVLRDPLIRSWRLIPEGFAHFLFTDATASNFYRPIQRLTYTLDYSLWGFAPQFYHLTNLLLHGAAAVALYWFALELTRKRRVAGLAALIWAIHPINSSAVIYVAGRADLLAALFGFGALWLGLRERRLASAICFLLALLSKECGFVFILIWGLLLLCQKRDLKRWSLLIPAVLCVYFSLRLTAEHCDPPRFTEAAPLVARTILLARAVALYSQLFLIPSNLHMERDLMAILPFSNVAESNRLELLTLAGIAILIAFGIGLRRIKDPIARLCLGSALIAYLPISNLFPLNATFAEHWFYLPGAFLLIASGAAVASISPEKLQQLRRPRLLVVLVLLCWLGFLATQTLLRNADWKDSRTFFTRTIAAGGENSRMWSNLGGIELQQGNAAEALACFQKAMKSPQPFALLGIASAEMKLGDYANARLHIEEALKIPFIRAEALERLAVLEYQQYGRERIDLLREAAQIAPKNWAIQKRYLQHLSARGEGKQAIHELQGLLKTQSYRSDSWRLLGDLLTKEKLNTLALSAYKEAGLLDVRSDLNKARP